MRVRPGSRSESIVLKDGVVTAAVSSPPVNGKANRRLEELLAGFLGVPKSSVVVTAGHTARIKTVQIEGLSTDDAMERLQPSD